MKNFWGYAHNERFGVGCTGQSVYIYDTEGRELKRFSGLRYAYTPLLCPGKPLLAVKSAEPWLLFYDLERLEAVKKLRLRKPNQQTQDDGCCFSPDGERFFNLEAQNDMTGQLVIYDTREFAEQARLFEGARLVPQHIEPAEGGDAYFLLGYERPATPEGDNRENTYFVARLDAKGDLERRPLDAEQYRMLAARKSWERAGFTAKKAEWTFPYLGGEIPEAAPLPLERVFAEA